MATLRTHDLVLADGTFRVVITPRRHVIAVIDAPVTALGPLHIALQIDRSRFLPRGVSPTVLEHPIFSERSHVTAGLFDSVEHAFSGVTKAVSHAAEGTFDAAAHASSAIAQPTFSLLKGAAAQGVHAIGDVTHPLEVAAHVVMRAKLGDLNAKKFIQTMASAAKSGVHAAMHVADTLLDASKLVAKAMDVPTIITSKIPILNNVMRSISPYELYQHAVSAIQKGDFKALEHLAKDELSLAQSVISLVPGIGTGISSAISAGLAVLDGGGALDLAIHTAYGAIPIPPGIREITDTILDTVLAFVDHPHDMTDVAVQVARDQVPSGLPRDVFDTLVNLVVKRQPIQKVAGGLVDHFVSKYAPAGVGVDLDHALAAASAHLPGAFQAVQQIAPIASHVSALPVGLPGVRMVQPLMRAAAHI
jgi:hypothetical protein